MGSSEGAAQSEFLDVLSGLVEKSLVVLKRGDEGGVRYRLLEPIRQYALGKLQASGEVEAAKHAHAQYFLALAEEAEPELLGPREDQWYERLEEEHDNIRAAPILLARRCRPRVGAQASGSDLVVLAPPRPP